MKNDKIMSILQDIDFDVDILVCVYVEYFVVLSARKSVTQNKLSVDLGCLWVISVMA